MKKLVAVLSLLWVCLLITVPPVAYAGDCPPPESCQTDCGDTLAECIQEAIDTSPSESELLLHLTFATLITSGAK